eukprot:298455-Pelagomonas_calceolata.AAC.2
MPHWGAIHDPAAPLCLVRALAAVGEPAVLVGLSVGLHIVQASRPERDPQLLITPHALAQVAGGHHVGVHGAFRDSWSWPCPPLALLLVHLHAQPDAGAGNPIHVLLHQHEARDGDAFGFSLGDKIGELHQLRLLDQGHGDSG